MDILHWSATAWPPHRVIVIGLLWVDDNGFIAKNI